MVQVIAVILVIVVFGAVVAWQVREDVRRRRRDGEDLEALDWRNRWFRGH